MVQTAQSTTPAKRCYCCTLTKPTTEFYKSSSKKDGLQDKCKSCEKLYRKQNPDKRRDWMINYRAKQFLQKGSLFEEGIKYLVLYERDKGICQICKRPCTIQDGSVDHIIPFARGGNHTWKNIQLAHLLCNQQKSDLPM